MLEFIIIDDDKNGFPKALEILIRRIRPINSSNSANPLKSWIFEKFEDVFEIQGCIEERTKQFIAILDIQLDKHGYRKNKPEEIAVKRASILIEMGCAHVILKTGYPNSINTSIMEALIDQRVSAKNKRKITFKPLNASSLNVTLADQLYEDIVELTRRYNKP
ncbi:hypothetical protein [Azospirillum griseum]|uniref:Uncharacterized protein n=1 Tax=Azospirillum griseum TaxID=2496639 RepID=A0A3S0JE42_9PROT|nr:hypothetical protein [Azospirillum griseum]RTR13446.1 hypothetical protein EJ903_24650 [Azospirillum griseum]